MNSDGEFLDDGVIDYFGPDFFPVTLPLPAFVLRFSNAPSLAQMPGSVMCSPTGFAGVSVDELRAICWQMYLQVDSLGTMIIDDRLARDQFQSQMKAQLDSVVAMLQASSNVADSPKKSVWICPVCQVAQAHMRSFKGHIKRLVDSTLAEPDEDAPKHRCVLSEASVRHKNLVSRSGSARDNFRVKSMDFANALWQIVNALTSSDEAPALEHLCACDAANARGEAPM
jgi:hypothetical protein